MNDDDDLHEGDEPYDCDDEDVDSHNGGYESVKIKTMTALMFTCLVSGDDDSRCHMMIKRTMPT